MSGVSIEYFLGLYFLVISITFGDAGAGKKAVVFEWVKFVFAVIFLVAAFFGKSLI